MTPATDFAAGLWGCAYLADCPPVHYHDAAPDTACRCPKPGTYARQAPNPLEG